MKLKLEGNYVLRVHDPDAPPLCMQRRGVEFGGAIHKSEWDESIRVHAIPPRLHGDVQGRVGGHLPRAPPDASVKIPWFRGRSEAARCGREHCRNIGGHQAQIPTHSCHQLRSPWGHREQPQPSRYVHQRCLSPRGVHLKLILGTT
jgi:hypothetical protein